MTLAQRIDLIEMLISENSDATIKDYLELVGDARTTIEFIEPSPPVPIAPKVRKPSKTVKKYYQSYHLRL